MDDFPDRQATDFLPPRKILTNQREERKHHRRLQAAMDASGADKLILLVQTNQVLYDKSAAGYKVKDALEKGDIWQIGVDIAVNSDRTLIYGAVSRFSFLGGGVTAPSDLSFLVSRSSFLVSRFSVAV